MPPPLSVTRFVSAAPLPEVYPRIVVFDGMFSVPLLPSVMVCAVANVAGEKMIAGVVDEWLGLLAAGDAQLIR
jgi:hypothetical protein